MSQNSKAKRDARKRRESRVARREGEAGRLVGAAGARAEMERRAIAEAAARAAGRACGGCTACCYTFSVQENRNPPDGWDNGFKPGFTHCNHEYEGGCRIYESRPRNCRRFKCFWLLGQLKFEDGDRPDKIGIVAQSWPGNGTRHRGDELQAIQVQEVWPGAASEGRAKEILDEYRRHGMAVVVLKPAQRDILTPLTINESLSWLDYTKGVTHDQDNIPVRVV